MPEQTAEEDYGGEQMRQDYDDDDDDEVDFNLGGGGAGASNNASYSQPHDLAPSPPPYGTVHKASAKEDG